MQLKITQMEPRHSVGVGSAVKAELGGVDISRLVKGIHIHLVAGEINRAFVEIYPQEMDIDVDVIAHLKRDPSLRLHGANPASPHETPAGEPAHE